MGNKSMEERIADIQRQRENIKEKDAQLKAKEKELQAKINEKERKARTKRLIEVGAVVEGIYGKPIEKDQLVKLHRFLADQEDRGNFLSRALDD